MLVAAERAGATVLRGQPARAIEATARGVRVQVGSDVLDADAAILATGKHNVRGLPRRASRLTAFKMVFEPTSAAMQRSTGVVQLASYRGGYIGSCIWRTARCRSAGSPRPVFSAKPGMTGGGSSTGSPGARRPSAIWLRTPSR